MYIVQGAFEPTFLQFFDGRAVQGFRSDVAEALLFLLGRTGACQKTDYGKASMRWYFQLLHVSDLNIFHQQLFDVVSFWQTL